MSRSLTLLSLSGFGYLGGLSLSVKRARGFFGFFNLFYYLYIRDKDFLQCKLLCLPLKFLIATLFKWINKKHFTMTHHPI